MEYTDKQKKQLLAKYLDISPREIKANKYQDNLFETEGGEEWLVVDYDTAERLARRNVLEVFDDLGLESFSLDFQQQIIDYGLDQDLLDEMVEDDIGDEIFNDTKYCMEDWEERFELNVPQEDIDRAKKTGEVSDKLESELRKVLWEDYKNNYNDGFEYFQNIFGTEQKTFKQLRKIADEQYAKELIDLDYVVDEVISQDGIAMQLASYDFKEVELADDLYAYRTN